MKVKTADLIGPALDWAVAKCEAIEVEYINDGITRCLLRVSPFTGLYSPSNDWSQGGPIIEREWLDTTSWPNESNENLRWECMQYDSINCRTFGPTPLVAAMRCLLAANLGDEVDVPDELV